jgi:hypothetical protein
MRPSSLLVVISLFVSWAFAAAFPYVCSLLEWHPEVMPPEVPFVAGLSNANTDVRSSVYYLIVVLGSGLISALLLEVAKFITRERSASLYVALTCQQALLVADVIRSHAWDWWLYLLSIARISPIDAQTWMEPHPSLTGRWPWPTGVLAVALAAAAMLSDRRANRGSESSQEI